MSNPLPLVVTGSPPGQPIPNDAAPNSSPPSRVWSTPPHGGSPDDASGLTFELKDGASLTGQLWLQVDAGLWAKVGGPTTILTGELTTPLPVVAGGASVFFQVTSTFGAPTVLYAGFSDLLPLGDLLAQAGDDEIQWASAPLTSAVTAKDGTGGATLLFTADAAFGSFVKTVRAKPAGTNVASVLRVFVNNGSDPTVATNNVYFDDVGLPATTLTEVGGQPNIEASLSLGLPPGYRLYVTIGTTVAAGWYVSAIAGKS